MNNLVMLKQSDPTSSDQHLMLKKGQLINQRLKKVIGVNGNEILSYSMKANHRWKTQQVGEDPEQHFVRGVMENKPNPGAWPFDCEKIIPCTDIPQQTCGCRPLSDASTENLGLLYNIGSDSTMREKLDFQSCEELKYHGLAIRGYFMINGAKTYCDSWSK